MNLSSGYFILGEIIIKIWHISDTHGLHGGLDVPQDVDMIIHSGDCANSRDSAKNTNEVLEFLEWFKNLPIKHKVFVAGNHDVSIERRMVTPGCIRDLGIVYLENDSANVDGLNIWGSPITPSFGNGWAWNMKRSKISIVWDTIPEDTDIIVTHGPPTNVLDISINYQTAQLEFCGCSNLRKRVLQINPKLHCFGHIHNGKVIRNAGLTKFSDHDTIYSNATVVQDGKMNLVNNGNIIQI